MLINKLKFILPILFFMFAIDNGFTQTSDQILFKVGNELVTKSEFTNALNNANSASKQTIDEFLQSYIDFKLKIAEAKLQKTDENESFKLEYNSFLEQMKSPYLEDSITINSIGQTEHARLLRNLDVFAVLVKFPEGKILPKDTLNAYKTALDIRKLIDSESITNFENFQDHYGKDKMIEQSIIAGRMGWQSAFMHDLKLENAIYNTPIGETSQPIRCQNGYYIIKISGERPDMGEIDVSHILFRYPQQYPTAAEKDSVNALAQKVYQELLAGASFGELCQLYSADALTIPRDGYLGKFSVRNPLPEEYESLLFGMNIDDITKPIETEYGYHIFKQLTHSVIGSWDQMKKDILGKISSDRRYDVVDLLNRLEIRELSKDYPYAVNTEALKLLENIANTFHPKDSVFSMQTQLIGDLPFVVISDNTYPVSDFTNALLTETTNQSEDYNLSTDYLHSKLYAYILGKLIIDKSNKLTLQYPELAEKIKDYYEGMLLYEIMNKEVWGKANADKQALEALFEQNKDKYNWTGPKFKGIVVNTRTKKLLDEARKIVEANKDRNDLPLILSKALQTDSINKNSVLIDAGLWGENEQSFVDFKIFKTKKKPIEIVGYPYFFVEGKLLQKPENMQQIRGLVEDDYQKTVEENWMKSLREKHKIEINEEVLNSIRQTH